MARKIAFIALFATLFYRPAKAEPQSPEFQYVGAFHINTSQDAKVLVDWYSKFFGVEMKFKGVWMAKWDTKAGPFQFSIHKRTGAPTASSSSVSLVFRVNDCRGYVKMLEGRGLTPPRQYCELTDFGRFAQYEDPDGNEMSIWEK